MTFPSDRLIAADPRGAEGSGQPTGERDDEIVVKSTAADTGQSRSGVSVAHLMSIIRCLAQIMQGRFGLNMHVQRVLGGNPEQKWLLECTVCVVPSRGFNSTCPSPTASRHCTSLCRCRSLSRWIRQVFQRVPRLLFKDQVLTVPHQPVQHRVVVLVVWNATPRPGKPQQPLLVHQCEACGLSD